MYSILQKKKTEWDYMAWAEKFLIWEIRLTYLTEEGNI